MPKRSRMDPVSILADVLVLHIWTISALQGPEHSRYTSMASSDDPLCGIRVKLAPVVEDWNSLTSQLSRISSLASISLLPEIQAHQQILRAANVARSRHNRDASLHDLLPDLLHLPLHPTLQKHAHHAAILGRPHALGRGLDYLRVEVNTYTHQFYSHHPPKAFFQDREVAIQRQRNV